ncbi:MAG: twin-arginine translocase TatA/TatE family subunit [Chitinophagaceae bacterium]
MDLFAPNHIILILLIVVLLFGGKKIPELMRGLGKGMREFTDAKNNVKKEIDDGINDRDRQVVPPVSPTTTTTTTPTQP